MEQLTEEKIASHTQDKEWYIRLREVDSEFNKIYTTFKDLTFMLDAIEDREGELVQIYYDRVKYRMIDRIRDSLNMFDERPIMLDLIEAGRWISKNNSGWKF